MKAQKPMFLRWQLQKTKAKRPKTKLTGRGPLALNSFLGQLKG
jgi:hypothetical protein